MQRKNGFFLQHHCYKGKVHCHGGQLHCYKGWAHCHGGQLHCYKGWAHCHGGQLHCYRGKVHCHGGQLHCYRGKVHCHGSGGSCYRGKGLFLSFLRRRRGGPFCPLPDGHPGFPRSASGYLGRKCLHLHRHIVVRCFLPKISGCLFNKKLTIQQFFIA